MSLLSFLPILIVLSGTYLLFKLRFFFVRRPIRTLKFAFCGKNKKKSILSLMLALAGTLGVGNISGVAIGIAIGGAGSVFWLVISSLFSSAIKYSEVYISSRSVGVGIISVIRDSFGSLGAFLSRTYAILAVILSFSMGCAFQGRAISEAADTQGRALFLLAFLLTLFALFICLLGKERIKGAVALIIPLAAIIYTGMCLFVIFANFSLLPSVIKSIFSSAFSIRGASGGILGFIASSGMKEGFARGLLSNEAGAGTSSLSHTSHIDSSLSNEDCKRAGIFGILEVIFDTLLLCPLTAFAILLGFKGEKFDGSLTELSEIFTKSIGAHADSFLLASIIFFAISTVFCWYYYGRTALSYLFGKRGVFLYTAVFFLCFFISMLSEMPLVLFITDTTLFLLSIISLSALIKNRALLEWDENTLERDIKLRK